MPPYSYDYPRPAVTVDLVLFALTGDELQVLLVRRKHDPFAGLWALPGGFLEIDEPIEAGALRELREETGFEPIGPISFLGVYGEPGRDPRGRTISLAHVAVVRAASPDVEGGDDAAEAAWRLARKGGSLAFDHELMLKDAVEWLAEGVRDRDLGLGLLPEVFEESDAQGLFRALFDSTAGAGRWLKRMEKEGKVEPSGASGGLYRSKPKG